MLQVKWSCWNPCSFNHFIIFASNIAIANVLEMHCVIEYCT